MKGRTISPGKAEGEAIVSPEPIGFYGGIDAKTGKSRFLRISSLLLKV